MNDIEDVIKSKINGKMVTQAEELQLLQNKQRNIYLKYSIKCAIDGTKIHPDIYQKFVLN